MGASPKGGPAKQREQACQHKLHTQSRLARAVFKTVKRKPDCTAGNRSAVPARAVGRSFRHAAWNKDRMCYLQVDETKGLALRSKPT